MRLTLNEVKKRIEKMIPKGLDYEIDVEAGSIAIITHTPREFGKGGGESLTVKIAKSIKRRVVIRPHRDLLLNEDQVEQKIMETIPNEAQVRNIFIDPALSEVTIGAWLSASLWTARRARYLVRISFRLSGLCC